MRIGRGKREACGQARRARWSLRKSHLELRRRSSRRPERRPSRQERGRSAASRAVHGEQTRWGMTIEPPRGSRPGERDNGTQAFRRRLRRLLGPLICGSAQPRLPGHVPTEQGHRTTGRVHTAGSGGAVWAPVSSWHRGTDTATRSADSGCGARVVPQSTFWNGMEKTKLVHPCVQPKGLRYLGGISHRTAGLEEVVEERNAFKRDSEIGGVG